MKSRHKVRIAKRNRKISIGHRVVCKNCLINAPLHCVRLSIAWCVHEFPATLFRYNQVCPQRSISAVRCLTIVKRNNSIDLSGSIQENIQNSVTKTDRVAFLEPTIIITSATLKETYLVILSSSSLIIDDKETCSFVH